MLDIEKTIATLVLLPIFALTGCAATADPPASGGVTLSLQFPSDVSVNATAGQRTTESAQLTLTNNSSAPVTLERPNDCQAHTWTVTDAAHQTVDDMAICPMIFMPVELTIAAHGTFAATKSVALDGTKYTDGARYTLHYSFWGIASDASFTAHVVK